ncbi:MAG: hypothetical protein COX81_02730 [Candidatus Magasanikbacteria bacterium CG_4_10_14_0_2_um_filter_37_12]|uniref:Uncharacterized protein n=1 Tax=Candidatus Magasanikbacteria bacterium CG_4_10_14_0_2_um_filter_37_12 TaxID=1974637 RepID=A0A2M7V7Q7_9BACT|nr:MAG: hypothetical protein COX81_02730 [Candidatus Magasanikbacteria bacterium CG_4_10_14_0_2_um_filter_37_12]
MSSDPTQQGLSTGQKTGFVFLLVFGFLAVGLGFIQMRNNIFGPFFVSTNSQDLGQASVLLDQTVRLQSIDTDLDGLKDFEELTFYQTSPYLPDTDSDGLSDSDEINAGTDPLCPEGKDCSVSEFVPEKLEDNLILTPVGAEASGVLDDGFDPGPQIQQLLGDPSQLRAMLISTGQFTEAQIAEISDEALIKMANNVIQNNAPANFSVGTSTTAVTLQTSDLSALLDDPVKLRAAILATGNISAADLEKIDDEMLVQVAKEVLSGS